MSILINNEIFILNLKMIINKKLFEKGFIDDLTFTTTNEIL